MAEQRRFVEGIVQRGKLEEREAMKQRDIAAGSDPAVADHKRAISAGQQQARSDMLADINETESTGATA